MTSAPADASAVKGSRWKGAMGRLPLVVGAAMLLAGTRLSTRFVVETGDIRPEVAGLGQTESMLIGALLADRLRHRRARVLAHGDRAS